MVSAKAVLNYIPGANYIVGLFGEKADPAAETPKYKGPALDCQELELCMTESFFYSNLSHDDQEAFANSFLSLVENRKGKIEPDDYERFIAQSLDTISVKPHADYPNEQRAEIIARQWQNLFPAVKHVLHLDLHTPSINRAA